MKRRLKATGSCTLILSLGAMNKRLALPHDYTYCATTIHSPQVPPNSGRCSVQKEASVASIQIQIREIRSSTILGWLTSISPIDQDRKKVKLSKASRAYQDEDALATYHLCAQDQPVYQNYIAKRQASGYCTKQSSLHRHFHRSRGAASSRQGQSALLISATGFPMVHGC